MRKALAIILLLACCGCLSTQWHDAHWRAHRYAERLDALAEQRIKPGFYRKIKVDLTVHVCGTKALKERSPSGGQMYRRDGSGAQIWVIGDDSYISQWGLGHEIAHHLERWLVNLNPDRMGE